MTSNKFYGKVIRRGKQKIKGGNIMAVKVTSKKPLSGNSRSHALNATKRKQNLNLQVERLADGTKVRLTAREKRTLRKDEKIAA